MRILKSVFAFLISRLFWTMIGCQGRRHRRALDRLAVAGLGSPDKSRAPEPRVRL